jgi:hypothetical protein
MVGLFVINLAFSGAVTVVAAGCIGYGIYSQLSD